MQEKAKQLNLMDYIVFLGSLQNTAEIYKISDITINCSIKEGLALTSYESLSMGVPIVSSDVGGQKELITPDVGETVPLLQNEEDIYIETYNKKEIQNYVDAINKILGNLEYYKNNARTKILDNFTINKMVEKMSNIFEETYNNPKVQKIENGKNLSNNKNITKELITLNLKNDEIEYKWECSEYEKKVYGRAYSIKGMNYKKELIKEKLWNIALWRGAIKVYHIIRGK